MIKIQGKNGITIIALVITIVILMIIASITVTAVIGNNGIIEKTKETKKTQEILDIKEQIQIDIMGKERMGDLEEEDIWEILEKYGTVTTDIEGIIIGVNPTKYPEEEILLAELWDDAPVSSIYTDSDGKSANIPDGFTVSIIPEETKIDDGLVVIAPDGSEFVWVPVPNPVVDVQGMNDTQINSAIAVEIAAGRYPMAIKVNETDYKGVVYYVTGGVPVTIGATGYYSAEPEVLTSTGYDNTAANYTNAGIIGITTAAQFKTQLQSEYNAMVESVILNGGFYIGRYETSTKSGNVIQSKANVVPMRNINWYSMYQRQKAYANDNSITEVTSGMIYGSQLDQVMIWMKDVENSYSPGTAYIKYAVNMGWYSNNSGNSVKNTGTLAAAKVKNIYDLAGNVSELTIEANLTSYRVNRGGNYMNGASVASISGRAGNYPTTANNTQGSRTQLHL